MRPIFALPVLALLLLLNSVSADTRPGVHGERVVYTHDGVELTGYLAHGPSVEGPRPGVIVVHEWWGHDENARRRADMLAEAGYVALALDMYGTGKLAEHPSEAGEFATAVRTNRDLMLGRFEAAGAPFTFVDFAGAAHSFTNPGADAIAEKFGMPLRYDERADRDSWNWLIAYLNDRL
jgi:dienelactone hydrolase